MHVNSPNGLLRAIKFKQSKNMAFSSISNLWNKWNIRSFVLLSLSLQVFLVLFSPIRKKTANKHVIFLLWLAYLTADWVAAFAIGLISDSQGNLCNQATEVDGKLQAFWASFLLLHLGGPDTITAFSLEDSSLWGRHMLSLTFQIGAAIYVFAQIFPGDRSLMIPTMLVFLVGIIKNAERTLALNRSSLPRLREWVLSYRLSKIVTNASDFLLNHGPGIRTLRFAYGEEDEATKYSEKDEAKNDESTVVELRELVTKIDAKMIRPINGRQSRMLCFACNEQEEEAKNDESTVVELGYCFFQIFKIFLGDLMFTRAQRRISCRYFAHLSAMDALRVISIELQFIYEVLHTKTLVIRSKLSYIFRFITFMGVVVAFVLFNRLKKDQLSKLDVKITYILLFGGIVLDMIALFMLIFSDWTLAEIMQNDLRSSDPTLSCLYGFYSLLLKLAFNTYKLRGPRHDTCEVKPNEVLDTPLIFRRWSESISACNLLSMSLEESPRSLGSTTSSILFNFPFLIAEKIISYFHQAGKAIARGCGLRTTEGKIVITASTKYISRNPFPKKLWIFIFKEVRCKSKIVRKLTEKSMSEESPWWMMRQPPEKLIKEGPMQRIEPGEVILNVPAGRRMYEPTEVGHESRNTDEDTEVRCESGNIIEDIVVASDVLTDENQDDLTEVRKIFEARGDLVVKFFLDEKKNGYILDDVTKVSYDDSIIMWHIATEIWYNKDISVEKKDEKEFSKILSDYMLYLLLNQPNVMSAVAGIAQINTVETLEELQRHIKDTTQDVKKLCMQLYADDKAIFEYVEPLKAILWQGVKLARKMERLEDKKWEMISRVWIEMLSYAAIHIKAEAHVQVLSKGGELLAFIWLLMTHFGCVYKPEFGICYEQSWSE